MPCPAGLAYADFAHARKAVRRIVTAARVRGVGLYCYQCERCHGWHIGKVQQQERATYRMAAERIRRGDLRGMGVVVENGLAGSAADNPAMSALVKRYRAQAAG